MLFQQEKNHISSGYRSQYSSPKLLEKDKLSSPQSNYKTPKISFSYNRNNQNVQKLP